MVKPSGLRHAHQNSVEVKNKWCPNSVPFICLYDTYKDNLSFTSHLSTAQAAGCRPLTAQPQVHSAASSYETFGGCPVFWPSCCQYHATDTPYLYFIHLSPTPYEPNQFTLPLNKTRLSRLYLPDTYDGKAIMRGLKKQGRYAAVCAVQLRWTVVGWDSFLGRYVDLA